MKGKRKMSDLDRYRTQNVKPVPSDTLPKKRAKKKVSKKKAKK